MSDLMINRRRLPIYLDSLVDDMTELTPNDMRIYTHLARRANNATQTAWPSYQSMGDHCFASVYAHPDTRRKAAVKSVQNLIKAKLLSKTERKNSKGNQSNIYELLDPPVGINTSQPVGINTSQPVGINGTPRVGINRPLKDTPIEDTPIEDQAAAPRGDTSPGGGDELPDPYAVTPSVPEPEPTPSKPEKPKKVYHPAVEAYRSLYDRLPSAAQIKIITAKDPPLDKWVRAITKWAERGHRPNDIEGMLDWTFDPARMERKPKQAKGSVYMEPGSVSRPDDDEYAELRKWKAEAYPEQEG